MSTYRQELDYMGPGENATPRRWAWNYEELMYSLASAPSMRTSTPPPPRGRGLLREDRGVAGQRREIANVAGDIRVRGTDEDEVELSARLETAWRNSSSNAR